jgi:hypothetical protein
MTHRETPAEVLRGSSHGQGRGAMNVCSAALCLHAAARHSP